eukprot:CAMPEP_0183832504 /NCGR_PEP_ID=MMETSP0807_2-20130328/5424_1 /TAXON_ID=88271 /ORGANISM="Picocystis salinarum, Strain CCMP1897" /LENGTH=94 /DNA_ID=CAMNT_0026078195 /DNA_START=14 /DNA_END=295 /DNA_ORIENTATION=-
MDEETLKQKAAEAKAYSRKKVGQQEKKRVDPGLIARLTLRSGCHESPTNVIDFCVHANDTLVRSAVIMVQMLEHREWQRNMNTKIRLRQEAIRA